MEKKEDRGFGFGCGVTLGIAAIVLVVLAILFIGLPYWGVWNANLAGQAHLAEAEHSKKILVETAKAKKEAAIYEAQAEVERARGVAKANAIIGKSLEDNEAYLRYLWIQGLHNGSGEIIYVPTEANLPILEAGRHAK